MHQSPATALARRFGYQRSCPRDRGYTGLSLDDAGWHRQSMLTECIPPWALFFPVADGLYAPENRDGHPGEDAGAAGGAIETVGGCRAGRAGGCYPALDGFRWLPQTPAGWTSGGRRYCAERCQHEHQSPNPHSRYISHPLAL